jgi:hypothetical protein
MAPRYSLRRKKAKPQEEPERPFEFLKLSGELRNEIYWLVVISDEPIKPLAKSLQRERKALGLPQARENQIQPAVTRVSRQLRSEALPLYYTENTFNFTLHVPLYLRYPIESFCKIGTDHVKSITAIQIGCPFHLTVRIKHDKSDIEIFGDLFTEKSLPQVRDLFLTKTGLEKQKDLSGLHLIQIAQACSRSSRYTVPRPLLLCPCYQCAEWRRMFR